MTLEDMTLTEYLHGVNRKSATNSCPTVVCFVEKKMAVAKISAEAMHSGRGSAVALFLLTPCIPLTSGPLKSCTTVFV